MASIVDDRGFNQGFKLNTATQIRMNRRAEWMTNLMHSDQPCNILEIGCGTGEVAYWIAKNTTHHVLGTDICLPFINEANAKYQLPNLSYAYLNFSNIEDFKDQRFDYIIGNGILHHLYQHLDESLINLKNLLKTGGAIIFIEPNIYNPYCGLIFNIPLLRKWAKLEPDEMAFSKSFIINRLNKADFQKVNVKYIDFLLPGIPNSLVKPSIVIGDILEKIPVLKMLSQSIFIYAVK
jgi:2-polyprenyl-3-methyl-5-hydroxy-6-metoxy-1,4-benzoquinol methylase